MANSKIATTKKLIKNIVIDEETSRKEKITDVEKAYITYQTAISIDINYPLKNLQFIPSSIPLGSLDGSQRPIITSHGNTLAKSMKMMGNIRPIIVTKLKEKNGKYNSDQDSDSNNLVTSAKVNDAIKNNPGIEYRIDYPSIALLKEEDKKLKAEILDGMNLLVKYEK